MIVWTKQNSAIRLILESTGRFVADKRFVLKDLDEYGYLVREVYDWLASHSPNSACKPADASYPIWVSVDEEGRQPAEEGYIVLELDIPEEELVKINIMKWSAILDYRYIPLNEADLKRHNELLSAYHTSDTAAYMSQFYPEIKREIRDSWERLFDDKVSMGNDHCYGIIWEIKAEWIRSIT